MALTKGIGIVATIKYTNTDLEQRFRAGVGNDTWYYDVKHQLGYNAVALEQAVKAHNTNSNVGLIVTVGGVLSAHAALQYSAKPFLSLIGDPIQNFFPKRVLSLMVFFGRVANYLKLPIFSRGQEKFYGGIFLHTHLNNAERVAYLKKAHHHTDSQICLLSNPDSRYAQVETGSQHWPTNRGPIFHASTVPEIDIAFDKFKTNAALRVMIVTADGVFTDNRETIIRNANQSNKYVCYPFQIYAQGKRKAGRPASHTARP